MQVGEIVCGPGGEELREGDGTEAGMNAAAGEVGWLEMEGAQLGEVLGADLGEVVEQFGERLLLRQA